MDSSRRDLYLNVVDKRFIFTNNQIRPTLSPFHLRTYKTGMRLPKTGVSLCCGLKYSKNVLLNLLNFISGKLKVEVIQTDLILTFNFQSCTDK